VYARHFYAAHAERVHAGHAHTRHAHAGHAHARHAREAAPGHRLFHVPGHGVLLHARDLAEHAEVLAEPAHHLAHEQELLHQLVHGLLGLTGAARDALGAARLADERVRVALLRPRHRLDHRLDADELAVVEVDAGGDLVAEHRHLVDEV